jgi:cytoskeletal protein CcmA (bactofilin family)
MTRRRSEASNETAGGTQTDGVALVAGGGITGGFRVLPGGLDGGGKMNPPINTPVAARTPPEHQVIPQFQSDIGYIPIPDKGLEGLPRSNPETGVTERETSDFPPADGGIQGMVALSWNVEGISGSTQTHDSDPAYWDDVSHINPGASALPARHNNQLIEPTPDIAETTTSDNSGKIEDHQMDVVPPAPTAGEDVEQISHIFAGAKIIGGMHDYGDGAVSVAGIFTPDKLSCRDLTILDGATVGGDIYASGVVKIYGRVKAAMILAGDIEIYNTAHINGGSLKAETIGMQIGAQVSTNMTTNTMRNEPPEI